MSAASNPPEASALEVHPLAPDLLAHGVPHAWYRRLRETDPVSGCNRFGVPGSFSETMPTPVTWPASDSISILASMPVASPEPWHSRPVMSLPR
jgi:hypothetical protein